jgi:hypothetical protein
MSELTNNRNDRAIVRTQLLATASAFALMACISATDSASAADTDRPTIWIELGGQMEAVQGTTSPFAAPFMTAITPTPGPYKDDIFNAGQKAASLATGLEGEISFQPEDSNWIFSAGIRYGRSHANRHIHQQSPAITFQYTNRTRHFYVAPFADTKVKYDESHAVLDFSAGKDVGLGAFGRNGTSTFSVGVRFAQFSEKSNVTASGRPSVYIKGIHEPSGYHARYSFYNYTMLARAARSFHGVGPSLSWNASAALLGNKDAGELTFDWGINGAMLFGRQKAKTSHTTQAYHLPITQRYGGMYDGYYYTRVPQKSHHGSRVTSRSVTVPNIGGFAGVSVKYPNVKVSLGYRADFFFGAMDTGIDTAKRTTTGFYGPFANVGIGL